MTRANPTPATANTQGSELGELWGWLELQGQTVVRDTNCVTGKSGTEDGLLVASDCRIVVDSTGKVWRDFLIAIVLKLVMGEKHCTQLEDQNATLYN